MCSGRIRIHGDCVSCHDDRLRGDFGIFRRWELRRNRHIVHVVNEVVGVPLQNCPLLALQSRSSEESSFDKQLSLSSGEFARMFCSVWIRASGTSAGIKATIGWQRSITLDAVRAAEFWLYFPNQKLQ